MTQMNADKDKRLGFHLRSSASSADTWAHRSCAQLALALALLAPTAQAQNLSTLFDAASQYDATYLSAKSQYEADLAKAAQGRAGILPTAGLAATAYRSNFESNTSSTDRSFSAQTATLSATQPLYRPANLATYRQSSRQKIAAQTQLDSAEQDLIVRLATAYFDVLAAQDSLSFVQAQQAAVAEQLAAAKRNFEIGSATITDTREAQARYDLSVAQEIGASNELRVKKIALAQLVGKPNAQPQGLRLPLTLSTLTPTEVDAWVMQSESAHPSIHLAQANLEIAKLEIDKAQAEHKPSLDLTASYNQANNPNGTSTNLTGARTQTGSVGLSFNLPLFAGFATQNRVLETLRLEEKARTDLDNAKRSAELATRAAFFGVLSGQGQVKALEAAEASSQSALDANKLGYEVGVRINIDVLNATSQLYQTKRDLAKARYDVLVGELKLRKANGGLKVQDLRGLDRLLVQ